MNYETLDSTLQGRNKLSRKLANNTYARRENGHLAIRLHATDILTFAPNGDIRLDSGGWRTVTTKERLNRYLEGFYISQERGQWYLTSHRGDKWERLALYDDGLTIHKDGTFTGGKPVEDACAAMTLRRKVHKFAARYMDAFAKGEVPRPGPGDCFYCQMRTVEGNVPLGEATRNSDHILSHIEENYFVPSLLWRAFETMPHSQAMGWAIAAKWDPNAPKDSPRLFDVTGDGFMRSQLQKMLARYILKQLGQAA